MLMSAWHFLKTQFLAIKVCRHSRVLTKVMVHRRLNLSIFTINDYKYPIILKQKNIFMKKISLLLALFFIIGMATFAQNQSTPAKSMYFKFQGRLKAGMGQTYKALPTEFNSSFPLGYSKDSAFNGIKNDFMKTKWGFYGGANLDFYFHPNFGFGVDVDYFSNKLKYDVPQVLTDYVATQTGAMIMKDNLKNQSLVFVGIGPSFKVFTNKHWDIDVNIRGGLSHLNMGSMRYTVQGLRLDLNRILDTLLNFDYSKPVNAFGLKAGIFVNYWFNSWIGVTLGADYIHTFKSAKKIDENPDYIFQYKNPDYYLNTDGTLRPYSYFDYNTPTYHPTKLNINHVSISAGLVFRFIKPEPKSKPLVVEKPIVKPEPKAKDILVLVKDSMTSIPMPDVLVSLKDKSGKLVDSKTTGADGKVTFPQTAPGDYTVSGTWNTLKTTTASISKDEFFSDKSVIYRELLLNNPNFLLEGVAQECSKKQNLEDVEIDLTNKSTGAVTKVKSGTDGKFNFILAPNTDYSIVGTREGYYSGTQDISTKGLSRSQTIYVKLTLCVEKLELNKKIVLHNIYYDFDKCNIRSDASAELDRLVQIMKENPTMEIELSSHTDQRGTDAYNNKLSQCRAESAVAYIISKGISKNRIVAKGNGKTQLLEDCSTIKDCPTTAQGDCPCHQNNRRTEVKITKM
jgi:outer membrane protein OmpA-like peptidoglycan-associated protein